MHTKLLDQHSRVVRYSVELVSKAGADDLALPTPCSAWNLGDLLDHMTAQHRGFAAAAAGHGDDLTNWEVHLSGVDEYRAAADHVLDAFAAVRTPDQEFVLPEFSPVQRFPAVRAIGFHFIDYLVHGWDVARALGLPFDPDPDLLDAGLPIALAVPDGKGRLEPGAAFHPALEQDEDATVLDRILLALGRSPDWR